MESDELVQIPIQWLNNYKINKNGKIWSDLSNKFLKYKITNGYYSFSRTITKDFNKCVTKNFLVHRVVAITFIPNPDNHKYVIHLNKNSLDNRIENLCWSCKNTSHSIDNISHPRKVKQIKNGEVINIYNTVTDASNAVALSRSAISKVCLGINKSAGGFEWQYVDLNFKHIDIDLTKGKQIYDYKDYFIFEDGNIYSSKRKVFLKPIINKSGYCYVTLCNSNMKKNYYVHILVAEHFLIKHNSNLQVNHKNKIKSDNKAINLEFVTCSENVKHALQASNTKLD